MAFKQQIDVSKTMSSRPKGENLPNELVYPSLVARFLVSLEMTGCFSTFLCFDLLPKLKLSKQNFCMVYEAGCSWKFSPDCSGYVA